LREYQQLTHEEEEEEEGQRKKKGHQASKQRKTNPIDRPESNLGIRSLVSSNSWGGQVGDT